MSDETYNGWKNYPTWAVNLWLSNHEGLYNYCAGIASMTGEQTESDSPYWTLAESKLYSLADHLKEFVTNTEDDGGISPDLGATFAADLLGYALECVDWHEIAAAWLEDAS